MEIIRPHWGRIALAASFSLVVSGLNGSFAWIVKPVVDNVFVSGQKKHLALISLSVFAIFIVRGAFEYLQNYLMKSVGAKIVRDLRGRLYRHIVYLPMSAHGAESFSSGGSTSSGQIISRVINDTGLLQELVAQRVRDFFVSGGTICFLTAIAFYRRWDLALIALVVLPFAFYAAGRLGKRLKAVAERTQKKMASITESLSEGLLGIKVIKSFSREDEESERFLDRNRDYYREFMRGTRIMEATTLIMELVAGVGVGFIIYYGGTLVAGGVITAGDFFSFLAAILLIYTPAKRLTQANNSFQQAKAYIRRVDEVFEREAELDGDRELLSFGDSIEFRGVSFKYPGREEDALKDVSVAVKRGEVVALVGRSGSGKTTFVDLLARFYRPDSGSIAIDGHDINTVTLRSLRAQIGIVGQDVFLFNDTVGANIAYGRPDASEPELIAASKAAYADEFIRELPRGYGTPVGQRGMMLSGGQRQRISIARAVLKNPPIFILDEATSSLDAQSELIVQKALDDLIESGGRTVFVVAHRLSTIKRADRIIVFEGGRLVESGSHDELMRAKGRYSRLYREES